MQNFSQRLDYMFQANRNVGQLFTVYFRAIILPEFLRHMRNGDYCSSFAISESERRTLGKGILKHIKKFHAFQALNPVRNNYFAFVWNGYEIILLLFRRVPGDNNRVWISNPFSIISEAIGPLQPNEMRHDSIDRQQVLNFRNLFKVCHIFPYLKRNQNQIDNLLTNW